jgi:hypothetical protein
MGRGCRSCPRRPDCPGVPGRSPMHPQVRRALGTQQALAGSLHSALIRAGSPDETVTVVVVLNGVQ